MSKSKKKPEFPIASDAAGDEMAVAVVEEEEGLKLDEAEQWELRELEFPSVFFVMEGYYMMGILHYYRKCSQWLQIDLKSCSIPFLGMTLRSETKVLRTEENA